MMKCGNKSAERRGGVQGFTLLELLVTVAVISVLIAILIPTLSSMRETARKAVCKSNLGEVYRAVTVYANDHNQRVPLGHRGGRRQWNTMIYSGTSGKYVLFGRLYVGGYLTKGEVFYCPSENAESQAFNTNANPWPPGSAGVNVQGGYASNPMGDRYDWGFAELPPNGMPRLDRMGIMALLSDGTGLPDRVDSRHADGVNTLFTEGSVKWIERKIFDEPLSQIEGVGPQFNPLQDEVWSRLSSQAAGYVPPME